MTKNANASVGAATQMKVVTGKKDEKITPVVLSAKKETVPTIDDLKNKAQILHLLRTKHDALTEKRKSLDHFTIVHDSNNAKIVVRDANGEEFQSTSPKSIKNLIEFWKVDFSEAILEIEKEIISNFS